MNSNPTPAIDRIPLAHSVRYVARGLPEVPNQYGPGTLAPSEITLTYRSAPDSGLGRVHAYVAGRIWVDGAELPLLPGGLYGQHYDEGLSNWPAWLAEEARLHDPAAVPSVSAVDQTTRDRIAETLAPFFANFSDWESARVNAGEATDALLAVLPPPADRAALNRVRALHLPKPDGSGFPDSLQCRTCSYDGGDGYQYLVPWPCPTVEAVDEELRRLADEAQQPAVGARQPDTETPGCPDPIECSHEAALGEAEAEAERQLAAVQRVRRVLEVEPVLNRSALEYRGLILDALMGNQPAAVVPAARAEQDGAQEAGRIVAYRLGTNTGLYCIGCTPSPRGDIWEPVTSEDLPDGGLCAKCGVDVLIEQPSATPDTEAKRCPAKHGALGRICELPLGHTGMHTGSGPNGSAVWDGDAP